MEAVGVTQAEAETLEVRLGLAVALVEEQPLRVYDCVAQAVDEVEAHDVADRLTVPLTVEVTVLDEQSVADTVAVYEGV